MTQQQSVTEQILNKLADSTKGVTVPEKPIEATKPQKPEFPPPKNYGGNGYTEKHQKDFSNNYDGTRNNCNHL